MKTISAKIFVIGLLLFASYAYALSISDYEKMTNSQKTEYLYTGINNLLTKVKNYDSDLEEKTRYYIFGKKEDVGSDKGLYAILTLVKTTEQRHPDLLNKIQVESAIKAVIKDYWKDQGITVPATIFAETNSPAALPVTNGLPSTVTSTNSTAKN